MGFDGIPLFVVEHLQSIAKAEGFIAGFDVHHECGSNVGDGFNGTMLSVKLVGHRRKELTVNLENAELALICKLQPTNAARQKNFSSELLFGREVHMYKTVLPALVDFQEKHGIPDALAFNCLPRCYVAVHEDGYNESVIIMQDLRRAGFELWDKKKPMHYESVRLLMEQMGRFHGLSFAIRDQNPELFQEFQDMAPLLVPIFSTQAILAMFNSCYGNLISFMDSSEDVQALEQIAKNFNKILFDEADADLLGNFGVINHGDCWRNNMMYVLQKGLPQSIVLFDWQLARVTSPAIDISFYLFTSTVKSLRDAHLDDLLKVYYINLADIIRATGSNPNELFPEEELHRQLRKFGKYGVAMSPLLIPLILADSSDIVDLDDLAETVGKTEEEQSGQLANITGRKTEEFVQRMNDVLSDARRYGWL